jgi:lactoylglutathione lyase
MKIEHIAIWVQNLEVTKDFYEKYFGCRAGNHYHNPKTNFQSYFLSFENGCRLELMQRPDINISAKDYNKQSTGIIHFAIAVGSKEKVDTLTATLQKDGYGIAGTPRTTGDGYYESVVLDPEGNIIEITI